MKKTRPVLGTNLATFIPQLFCRQGQPEEKTISFKEIARKAQVSVASIEAFSEHLIQLAQPFRKQGFLFRQQGKSLCLKRQKRRRLVTAEEASQKFDEAIGYLE